MRMSEAELVKRLERIVDYYETNNKTTQVVCLETCARATGLKNICLNIRELLDEHERLNRMDEVK